MRTATGPSALRPRARLTTRTACYDVDVLRYFVPRGAAVPLSPAPGAGLARALDAFVVGGPGGLRRGVVVRDLAGELLLLEEDSADALPDVVRRELGRHELARGRPPRFVDAGAVWLLAIDLLEQPHDSPGTNDPVHLYGRLSGPFGGAAGPAAAVHGQLTVTRGDLLRGFLEGMTQPFLVEGGAVFHATLPGEPVEEQTLGRGVVVAYALLPLDAGGLDGGNETCMLQIFDGLVHAFADDLRRHGAQNALTRRPLPVLDRRTLEARLRAEGFTIDGNHALRKTGLFARERRPLPTEWQIDDVEPVARVALDTLAPGFPDARSHALWSRIHPRPPTPLSPPARPASTGPTAARPKPTTVVVQPFSRRAPDWMTDFTTPAGLPPPRRTRVAPKESGVPSRGPPPGSDVPQPVRPEWMKDFE